MCKFCSFNKDDELSSGVWHELNAVHYGKGIKSSLAIYVSKRPGNSILEISKNVGDDSGDENHYIELESEETQIHYCPFCGRNLD